VSRNTAWVTGESPHCIGSLALSPEGRWLAYSDQDQGIVLVEAGSGRLAGRVRTGVFYGGLAFRDSLRDVLAFSPDGKMLAWSGVEGTADIFLIEARTQQVRKRLHGDISPVGQLVFSPDGRRLLSAGHEGSALVWDVRGARPAASPSPAQVARWWEQLADPNAEKAYRVMQQMTAHPQAALRLLRAKLKPTRTVQPTRLERLVADLGADTYEERERASRQLVALADAAEPALRMAMARGADLEVKRRARYALERIDSERLRPERAVEVLEMIGDAAALRLLEELARGLRGAALTTDAARAAARLARIASPATARPGTVPGGCEVYP
jgi:hypothetical protein